MKFYGEQNIYNSKDEKQAAWKNYRNYFELNDIDDGYEYLGMEEL